MYPFITSLKKIPKSVLMVGNSFMYYNNGADSFAARICREMDEHIGFTMITIGGSSLSWHPLKCYLESPHMLEFTPGHDNTLNFHAYRDGKIFDAIILQDNSQGPIHPQLRGLFKDYVAQFCEIIRQKDAEPLLMMTWAYKDHPEMTDALKEAVIGCANDNNVMALPVGLAFDNCRLQYPTIELTIEDKHHPTPAGTYLEACVIASALTGKQPVYKNFDGIGAARVKKDIIEKLQKVAWQTTCDFYSWKI